MNPAPETRSEGTRRRRWPREAWIPVIVLGAIVLFFVLGHVVAWLWAVTVADIFAWKEISFWQAWGLILLSQILFKANLSSGSSGASSGRKKKKARGDTRTSTPHPEGAGA